MRAIMIMFDSLCRRFMPSYGNNWVHAPNFQRLADRTVQFENCYVGSMPCMPARRELHTGRTNFLHRHWGPLEPFDDSMPEQLSLAGIHTHLVTDHQHYWEDGGSTYHGRYSTYEFVRGQEGDPFYGWAGPVDAGRCRNRRIAHHCSPVDLPTQDWINRTQFLSSDCQPQTITFDKGIDFIQRNAPFDNWFCQIETFDPHEPYLTQKPWQDLYPHDWDDSVWDWPDYDRVKQDSRSVEHIRCLYAALVSMCDYNLGRVLDLMDQNDLWQNTMLIVNTDHGFTLGEHGWWAKNIMPWYQETAHIPLWIWDPRLGISGANRQSLVQTIDLAPTLLEFFDQPVPKDVQGKQLRLVIENDQSIHEWALYGTHGGQVNLTNGRYVYMRGPADDRNEPINQYTQMPTHVHERFSVDEMRRWEQHPGFKFTKGCPVMRIPGRSTWPIFRDLESRLFDLSTDYAQENPLHDAHLECQMVVALINMMAANDAPPEQYIRLGLPNPETMRRDPGCVKRYLHCAR